MRMHSIKRMRKDGGIAAPCGTIKIDYDSTLVTLRFSGKVNEVKNTYSYLVKYFEKLKGFYLQDLRQVKK